MTRIVCDCGKGYASEYDKLCKFCREYTVRRAVAKKYGVKHRGDGFRLDDYFRMLRDNS